MARKRFDSVRPPIIVQDGRMLVEAQLRYGRKGMTYVIHVETLNEANDLVSAAEPLEFRIDGCHLLIGHGMYDLGVQERLVAVYAPGQWHRAWQDESLAEAA